MLHTVIVVGETALGVVGWINVNTADFARVFPLKRLQAKKIVSMNQ